MFPKATTWIWATTATMMVLGTLTAVLGLGGGPIHRQSWEAAGWIVGILIALTPLLALVTWAVRRFPTPPTEQGNRTNPHEDSPNSASSVLPRSTNVANTVGNVSGTTVQIGHSHGSVTINTANPPQRTPTPSRSHKVKHIGPAALEVHQAVLPSPDPGDYPFLTPYLRRAHDTQLRKHLKPALAGTTSTLVMLTGDSSTGKTRALHEALHDMAADRTLLRPQNPIDLLESVSTGRMDDKTVLWLNEAQRCFYGTQAPEAAAALLDLLLTRNGILAVGTLWTKPYWEELTRPGTDRDPHSYVRALLTSTATVQIKVPDRLTPNEQQEWARLAAEHDDQRMDDASRAGARDRGRVVQHLSGGPELLKAYLDGPGHTFTPVEHALLTSAIDARRMGHRGPLSTALLAEAANGLLDSRERPTDPNWATAALTALYTGQRANGERTDIRCALTCLYTSINQAGLEPTYEPADYLNQHLRIQRADKLGDPSLWQSLLKHTNNSEDLHNLAIAAANRGLFKHAVLLYYRSLATQDPSTVVNLFKRLTLDDESYEHEARWTVVHALLTDPKAIARLLRELHKEGQKEASNLFAKSAARNAPLEDFYSIIELMKALQASGQEEAERELLKRAEKEDPSFEQRIIIFLQEEIRIKGNMEGSGTVLDRAAEIFPLDRPHSVIYFIRDLYRMEKQKALTVLSNRAATDTPLLHPGAIGCLTSELHRMGQHKAAETLSNRAAKRISLSNVPAVGYLLNELHKNGTREALAVLSGRAATDAPLLHPGAIGCLVSELHRMGQHKAAETLSNRANQTTPPTNLKPTLQPVEIPKEEIFNAILEKNNSKIEHPFKKELVRQKPPVGRSAQAELQASFLTRGSIPLEDPRAIIDLIEKLKDSEKYEQINDLAARVAKEILVDGTTDLSLLVHELEKNECWTSAEILSSRLVNSGQLGFLPRKMMLHGRDIDGSPAQPWSFRDLQLTF